MGMFDTVIVECELPENCREFGQEFQTKDGLCLQEQYRITKDGILIRYPFRKDLCSSDEFRTRYNGIMEMIAVITEEDGVRFLTVNIEFESGKVKAINTKVEKKFRIKGTEIHRME